ncbi:hypothetical protein E7Z54_21755 [Nocardioides sp.]|nr:hypothetical protein E7Z54_21755 [Nocardioides sp.]
MRRLALALIASSMVVGGALAASGDPGAEVGPAVPAAKCGPGSMPESDLQGRVPASDHASGRAAQGYTCNTRLVSRHGSTGGFKVLRYTDARGNTCAFYDSTRMIGTDVAGNLLNGTGLGVVVLDMSDPAHPRKTANLVTPAMLSPHESLLVNEKRGLLAAVMGNAMTAPGVLDVYDVRSDCRRPRLLSSTPSALLGHESGFSPDGKTFWSSGAGGFTLTAIDVSNPRLPRPVFTKTGVVYHGLRFSQDGRTMYVANMGRPRGTSLLDGAGLHILDVSEVHARKPGARVHLLSDLRWEGSSIPQVAQPFTQHGHRYVLEVDEFMDLFGDINGFDASVSPVGAARIINVDDPRKPFVVSDIRLEVHQQANRTEDVLADPGARSPIGGYAAHYCSVPTPKNPRIAGCSMLGSGLRIFDISDVESPREVGYFNKPDSGGANALSQPAWDVDNASVWYSDGTGGFYAVRLTNGVETLLTGSH